MALLVVVLHALVLFTLAKIKKKNDMIFSNTDMT